MSEGDRYTREEWEEIQSREDAEAEERARESPAGYFQYVLTMSNHDLSRQLNRAWVEALLDVKLKQARLFILERIYGDE